ncbi:hypothetical protein BaRGS_00021450 [Batillaria attramentaria]|uniref:Uncharacterized protein n=1 Tax=Batillaria attramentaria TaxID=370345 RepID=A0ABD0KJF2_9CAEN
MTEISLPIKIAFVLLGIGFLFDLTGFSAPYWHVSEWYHLGKRKINYGLWRYCDEYTDRRYGRREGCGSMVSGSYGAGGK